MIFAVRVKWTEMHFPKSINQVIISNNIFCLPETQSHKDFLTTLDGEATGRHFGRCSGVDLPCHVKVGIHGGTGG